MIINVPAQSAENNVQRVFNFETNPVAVALEKKGLVKVHVNWGSGIICYYIDGTGFVASMPDNVKNWLWTWVNYQPVEPLTFELYVPKELERAA